MNKFQKFYWICPYISLAIVTNGESWKFIDSVYEEKETVIAYFTLSPKIFD